MIDDTLEKLSKWFWNPDFWLPVNFTWEEIQPRDDFKYPDNQDILKYPIFFAGLFLLFRYYVSDPHIFIPIARYFHLNVKRPQPPEQNAELENLFRKFNKRVPKVKVDRAAEKLQWKPSEVSKWLSQRHALTRLIAGEKFAENGFMLVAHAVHFAIGLYVLSDKKWVWDMTHCWYEYPYHEIDDDVWVYYMYGFGLYLSLTIHQLLQPSRKDKIAIYAHHSFTLSLFWFSWTMNFIRVGTLVLIIHQCADWILLIAKLFYYLHKETLTNIFFGITIVVWTITRLIIYPGCIIRSAYYDGPTYMFMPSAYLFFTLMIGLFLLNCMWMLLMIFIVVRKLQSGRLEDFRSSDDESEDEIAT